MSVLTLAHVDCMHTTNAQNLSYRLQVTEFAVLFLVSFSLTYRLKVKDFVDLLV